MPSLPRNHQPVPYAGGPRYVPSYGTLGELLGVRARTNQIGWTQLANAFDRFVQTKHAEKAAQQERADKIAQLAAAEQLRRDEMAAKAAERQETERIRREAAERQTRLDMEKAGDARAKAIGYGPIAEMDVDPLLASPERGGDVRYAFGPGTAQGPELQPTPEQERGIQTQQSIAAMGGTIGPNGQVVMPPRPAATKSLQRDTALVNGRPQFVNFNPETGTYTDLRGNPVEPDPMPPRATGDGGPRPLTQTAEAQIIQRLNTQWGAANKPIKELERQVALMDTGMEAVKRGDMAQGAQMVLVTFQKILDPPSVVRESEFMRSAAGQSLMNRVKGAYERLRIGGAGVTADELQKFATLAREASTAQRKAANLDGVKKRIGGIAGRYNIPPELIFEDDGDIGGGGGAKPKVTRDANGNLIAAPKGKS